MLKTSAFRSRWLADVCAGEASNTDACMELTGEYCARGLDEAREIFVGTLEATTAVSTWLGVVAEEAVLSTDYDDATMLLTACR